MGGYPWCGVKLSSCRMYSAAMTTICEVEFPDHVAPAVRNLIDRMTKLVGAEKCFTQHNQVMFALHTPLEPKRKKAYHLHLQIKPTRTGAKIVRPRVPKSGDPSKPLTVESTDACFEMARGWLVDATKMKTPREVETTENHAVLAGGQFESNHSKF